MRVVWVLSNLPLATVIAKYCVANSLWPDTVPAATFEGRMNTERLPNVVAVRQILLVAKSA